MRERVARLPLTTSFWPFTHIATRVAREVRLWRWRRQCSQSGAPVTVSRKKPGRAYMVESRRPGSSPGV